MNALRSQEPRRKPRVFSRPSLRHVLPVLFFLLASVPAVIIGVVLTNKAWDRELQTVREQHLQLARNLAGALERYAEDVEAVFQMIVIAKANVVQDLPPRKLSSLLGRLHFKYVGIIDRTGSVERSIFPPDAPDVEQMSRARLERLGIPGHQVEI